MNFEALYSPAARRLRPSIIRALLSLVREPGVISLAGGTPDSNLFDLERYAEIAGRVTREEGRLALQYGETQGLPALREQVSLYLEGRGVKIPPEQVLITNGSQQGIDLLCRLFLGPGDALAMEEPGYLGAINGFRNLGAEIIPLKLRDEEGLDPAQVEECLGAWKGPRPKLLYLTPTFQNPTGACLGPARRAALAELAARHSLLLVEDDPYGEISFDGPPPSPVTAIDRSGHCLFLGSFSKMSVPGLRLGWAAGPADVIRSLTLAKESTDICTSVLGQAIGAEFLKGGHLRATLPSLVAAYRKRRDVLHAALLRHLPKGSRLTRAGGGFFLWAELPERLNTLDLFKAAVAAKVAYVPGAPFYSTEGAGLHSMRLSFCAVEEPKLEEGARRLGEVLKQAGAAVAAPGTHPDLTECPA
ncbi:MAG TPA: PLP-dependent aminotransferase family protein [bacterium]|jgi:2-aminoadipate transaminase|nr:PLP-dependent aminotransferase family protein [bacterium]